VGVELPSRRDRQVLVASPAYLESSPWSAAEWDLFSRRRVIPRSGFGEREAMAVLPVLWTPLARPAPRRVAAVPRFAPTDLPDPAIGARYQFEGLCGLMQTDDDAYRTVVWKLALHIQTMLASQWVRPVIPPDAGQLRAGFGPSAPLNPRDPAPRRTP
jgi:hypothetical protein